ncbi:sensor histidine kinase [Verrucomicrobiota bacterium sgz303538]
MDAHDTQESDWSKEEGFRLLVEGVKEFAIFVLSPERILLTWNEGVGRILGYSREEWVGQAADIIFTEDDRANGAPQMETATAARDGQSRDERWHVRKDGSLFWASGMVTRICDRSGRLLGYSKIMADRTEEKKTEERLREIHNELREKNGQLIALNESRVRLLRSVSHELRNILNGLTLSTMGITEAEDEGDRKEMQAVCQRSLSDMATLLNQLLDYSALVEGRDSLQLERFELRELFEEIVTTWKRPAEEKGLILQMHFDPALKDVVSDRLKLRQIAGNLLSNAIKYRKKGQREGSVSLSCSSIEGSNWKLVVEDTGIGMAPDDMEKLFQEFSRIRPVEDVSGSGLGLSIVKRLVERLHGHIEVLSQFGEGSRFEVTFPRRMPLEQ